MMLMQNSFRLNAPLAGVERARARRAARGSPRGRELETRIVSHMACGSWARPSVGISAERAMARGPRAHSLEEMHDA